MPVCPPAKAYLSWSSGKDAAFALHECRRRGLAEVMGLLTTVNERFGRVAMHGVRRELLERQAAAAGLPLMEIPLPWPCSNAEYEARMAEATAGLQARGVTHMVFGDLFLEDIRAYREQQLARGGMQGIFPLWGRETRALGDAMLEAGLEAYVACVDPAKLDRRFAGRRWDRALLAELPRGVDPCGENGEFHTCVTAGPMFARPVPIVTGETVERDGFIYADLVPAD